MSKDSAGGGRAAMTALVVVGVAVGMLLIVRSTSKVEPYDPRSSADNGANAAVLLLQDLGATVNITSRPPVVGADERVFIIADRLDQSQQDAILAFANGGGVVVVADPSSSLHGGESDPASGAMPVTGSIDEQVLSGNQLPAVAEANVLLGSCSIGSLGMLRGLFVPDGVLFPVEDSQASCFGDGRHAFVIVRDVGGGSIVGFGDIDVVTNQYIRYADNASLVGALLAPVSGSSVRIMIGTGAAPSATDVGRGDETLADLVRPGVWMGLSQLALAFMVFCIARAIRPGRSVREPQPTTIPANSFVLATANLMQRAHHHQRASWVIRGEFYRELVEHYGAAPDISIDGLCALVASRSDVDPAELKAVLEFEIDGSRAGANEALRGLSERIERLRGQTMKASNQRQKEWENA